MPHYRECLLLFSRVYYVVHVYVTMCFVLALSLLYMSVVWLPCVPVMCLCFFLVCLCFRLSFYLCEYCCGVRVVCCCCPFLYSCSHSMSGVCLVYLRISRV